MTKRWLALAAAVAWIAGSALADARDLYKEGMDALEAERWAEAIARFEAAIAERPEPKAKSLFGREYLPHHQLGMARAGAGDCPGALAAFVEAERLGEAQKDAAAWRNLLNTRRRCETRLEAFGSELAELEARFENAAALERDVDDLAREEAARAFWSEGEPSFEERHRWGGELLDQARTSRDEAASSHRESRLVDAARLLTEAEKELGSLRSDVRTRLAAQVEQRQENLRENVDRLSSSARRILSSIADLAPYPEQLGRRVDQVRALLSRIDGLEDGAGAGRLEQLGQELRSAVGALRSAARSPPDPLVEMAESFLAGRYEQILVEDPEADRSWKDDPRAAAFACWLEAAARHGFEVLGSEDTAAEATRAKIRECLGSEVTIVLPATYVSPVFVDLWREVEAEVAAEGEAQDPTGSEADAASADG